MIPVNNELRTILQAMPSIENHGLLLDKYHEEHQGQEKQKPELAKIAALRPNDDLLVRVSRARGAALDAMESRRWRRKTSGPLTLQLARASSFENAGIGLHPVYGFVYLPGTGIKGLARAYAETVAKAPAGDIEAVFGRAGDDEASAGDVVFHDAWPVQWPRLVVDIVNNHHSKYYQGDGESDPPEDFENPIPVTFLSVAPGCEFDFAIAPRRPADTDRQLLEKAKEWLDGALTMLGAGAKTNAGYGRFAGGGPITLTEDFARFECTLTLETPAFLAGASQGAEDCDLRAASLRGLLRWWWRTLHTGHLGVSALRKLEAEIWGNTKAGGAVALHVEPAGGQTEPQSHAPDRLAGEMRLERPPDHKTAQGVLYASYGMQSSREKPARYHLAPGAAWRVTLLARARREPGGNLRFTAAQALEQGVLALWMLCEYGGVGAKSRRGFGSLKPQAVRDEWPATLEEVLRRSAALLGPSSPRPTPAGSSSHHMRTEVVRLPGKEPWFALDQLGYAYQDFCKTYKHRRQKWALGLPRRTKVSPVVAADERAFAGLDRHTRFASPLHFHVFRDDQGYAVRLTAFASPNLPDLENSRRILTECIDCMRTELDKRIRSVKVPDPPRQSSVPLRPTAPVRPVQSPALCPKVGTILSGTLTEKTSSGTWKVSVEGFNRPGPLQNSKTMPGSFQSGEVVRVKVKISKPNDPAFDWIKEG